MCLRRTLATTCASSTRTTQTSPAIGRERVVRRRLDLFDLATEKGLVLHGFTLRTFHICTAHAEARAVVTEGARLPASFRCPLARATCPMRTVLAARPGCDLVFLRGADV